MIVNSKRDNKLNQGINKLRVVLKGAILEKEEVIVE
jgi:hypothetical protein